MEDPVLGVRDRGRIARDAVRVGALGNDLDVDGSVTDRRVGVNLRARLLEKAPPVVVSVWYPSESVWLSDLLRCEVSDLRGLGD